MSDIHRNPVVRALKQLTPEVILAFSRDQVVGKFGLNKLLTPQERADCQDILSLLQERLTWHNNASGTEDETVKQGRIDSHQTTIINSHRSIKPVSIDKRISIGPQKQTPITGVVQQPSLVKNELPLSAQSRTVSQTYRNPAVRVLKQLTHQAIEAFNRKQVVGRLGCNKLLSPQERVLCQQQISHLRERLAYHDKMQLSLEHRLSEKKTMPFNKEEWQTIVQQLRTTEQQRPTTIEQQMPISVDKQKQTATERKMPIIQQSSLVKDEKPQPAMNQPLATISNRKFKEEQQNQTVPQPSSRFLSLLEPFGSLFQRPYIFHRQKRKSSQELEYLDDEQCRSLMYGNQEETSEWDIQKEEHTKKD